MDDDDKSSCRKGIFMKKIKSLIKNNKVLYSIAYRMLMFFIGIRKAIRSFFRFFRVKKYIKTQLKVPNKKIYYLGVPAHSNLGDLAQGVCIRKWLSKHYPDRTVIEIETDALVNTKFSLLKYLRKIYCGDDFIVFQSGYTTTDLGGYADLMHRKVIETLPNSSILMMPQTIFFKSEDNKNKTSKIYNQASSMLFLARDRVSYDMALEMFPDISVLKYPDIVTTMIGKVSFDTKRDGILMCCRDDSEKYYSDDEIQILMEKCSSFTIVEKTDTTKNGKTSNIVKDAEKYIYDEISKYSKYKVIITDRYHGTIFSLIAGTPVIIIKTNDHKVITGAEWFKGIYDEYVYVAETLDDAYEYAKKIFNKRLDNKLDSYFEEKYYDKLPFLFDEKRGE